MPNSNILMYTTEDGLTKIEATFENETVWLSLDQMAELFQRDKSTISRHIKNIFTDDNAKLLINVLDKLCIMYIKRIVMKQTDSSEQALLDKYQIIVNDMFTKMDQNYFAFCALITTDELREKCMKKFDSKI